VAQFGYLNQMQSEFDAADSTRTVHILGVNLAGLEAGNPVITSDRTIPWLQDTAEADVWQKWGVTWRDVVILDRQNRRFAVYNLTTHDLADSTNYDSLKTLLSQAVAAGSAAPPVAAP